MKKRILPILLALIMVMSLMPTVAMADEAAGDITIDGKTFSPVPESRLSTELVNGVTAEVSDGKVVYTVARDAYTGWDQDSGDGSVSTYTYVGVYVAKPSNDVDKVYTDNEGIPADMKNAGAFYQNEKLQEWFPVADKVGENEYTLFYGGREYVLLLDWYDADNNVIKSEYVKCYRELADPAAKAGNYTYETLEEAFDAAEDGDTVTLLKDVTLTGPGSYMDGTNKSFIQLNKDIDITFELNGKTLTMNSIGQLYYTYGGIEVYAGSLTIQDSVGTGKITGTSRWGGGSLLFVKNAELTLQSGELSITSEEFSNYYTDCNVSVIRVTGDTNGHGVFNMNGGSIVADNSVDTSGNNYCSGALFVFDATANLNNGKIVAKGNNTLAIVTQNTDAELIFNGVDLVSDAYGLANYGGQQIMKGGSIEAGLNAFYLEAVGYGDPVTNIEKGTIICDEPINEVSGSASVAGGTFSSSVAEYVSGDIECELYSDGKYIYYEHFLLALEDAKPGDIVTDLSEENPTPLEVFSLTFVYNNGHETVTTMVQDGGTMQLPTVTKPGYIFMGWKCSDGHTHDAGETVTVTGNVTFTAVWANMPDITPGTPGGDDDNEPVVTFPFTDVREGQWFYEAVKYVYDKGIMNGMDRYTFEPNGTLTRAMVWTMLARMDGADTEGGATWYSKAQDWAMSLDVSDGTNPMGAITREELVTMLWRYAYACDADMSLGEDTNILSYVDIDKVSDWAVEAFQWACGAGIIEGDDAGALNPTSTCTRAEAAAMFMRLCENVDLSPTVSTLL